MNPYEMTFIIRPDRDEDGTRAAVDTVVGRIASAGGEIVATIPWNPPRRRMAYTIRDFGDGFYVTTVFRIEPTALRGIENTLKLNDSVLRFMLVQATEANIKAAVQRLQQQQAPVAPPAPQPTPEGSAQEASAPVESVADGAEPTTEGAPVDTASLVPPVVEPSPVIGTEEVDAASVAPEAAAEPLPEPTPEPVTAGPVSESQE